MENFDNLLSQNYDVAIIGSGAGGGTLAYNLAVKHKRKVLLIEQGYHLLEFLQSDKNPRGGFVGGQTKLYGATLYRFRKEDFGELIFPDGVSPAWPISYEDIEPYYCQAEDIYKVHGTTDEDLTEPYHSKPYPFAAIHHEPFVEPLIKKLKEQGLHVSSLPRALDIHKNGKCVFCSTCDSYPCLVDGKLDTEIACINPAIESGNLKLITEARCHRLLTNDSGDKVTGMDLEYQGRIRSVNATIYVVACGTFSSPVLLMRSANKKHPKGLANSSGLVGRNLSGHNVSIFQLPGIKKIPSELHQKTFGINDFYLGKEDYRFPLGIFQSMGRLPVSQHLDAASRPIADKLSDKSLSCFTMSEIWPDPENRIGQDDRGSFRKMFKPNNIEGSEKLRSVFMEIFKNAGYLNITSYKVNELWHPVGTLRFGTDPQTSVLDSWCRTHDIANLYVVDSSFLPSAGSMNTSLTVMAQALRTGDHIHELLENKRLSAIQ